MFSRLAWAAAFTGLVCLSSVKDAAGWQILSSSQVPAGTAALTAGPQGLWCGYDSDADTLIRVLHPDNGQVIRSLRQPAARCRGITFYNNSIWYLVEDALYRLEQDGRVAQRFDAPYGEMRGLGGTPNGMWTSARDGGAIYLILFEPGGREVTRFRTTLQHVADLVWSNDSIWVTDPVDGFLHLFRARDQQEIDLFPTPAHTPLGIAWLDGRLSLIDAGRAEGYNRLYRINPQGQPTPRIMPGTEQLNLGPTELNFPRNFNLAIYNIGGANLQVDTLYLATGAAFAIGQIQRRFQIAPDQFAVIPLSVRTQFFGYYHDTLVIHSNDPLQRVARIALSALGIYPNRRLNVWPEMLNFGEVRADPWRDGRRLIELALINVGLEDLRVDSMRHRILDIFHIERPQFPRVVFTAETLFIPVWFEPHRGIEYLDTLLIYSNQAVNIAFEMGMRGTGSDSVYREGGILWTHRFGGGGAGSGAMAAGSDITNDDIPEAYALEPNGTVKCLNGFASEEADVLWVQDFRGLPFRPVEVDANGGFTAGGDLNAEGTLDLIIGSGGEDRAIYALDGLTGGIFWRWDTRWAQEEGVMVGLNTRTDCNGDGAVDPVILIRTVGDRHSALVRLDGATGRPTWIRNVEPANLLGDVGDLTRDGVAEFAVGSDHGTLYIFNGLDGGLITTSDQPDLASMEAISDVNGDGRRDLLCAMAAGGLAVYSVPAFEQLWSLDRINDVRLGVTSLLRIVREVNRDFALAADDRGQVFKVDLREGAGSWIVPTGRTVTTIASVEGWRRDEAYLTMIGYDNGRVDCLSGVDGEELWSFSGAAVNQRSAVHLISFADVDLGGTEDILGLFADGTIRCISTYGDLEVIDNSAPTRPKKFVLFKAHPNPFNSTLTLTIGLSRRSEVEVEFFDNLGRLAAAKSLGLLPAGSKTVSVDVREWGLSSSGTYWVRVRGEGSEATLPVHFVK